MTRLLSTAWALAVVLLAGCDPLGGATATEGGTTTVSGQVLDATTRRPVPRPPQVQLWQRPQSTGSLIGGAAYAPLGAPHATDAQGRFAFAFEAAARHEYMLRASDAVPGYYTDWSQVTAVRGGAKNTGLHLPVSAFAWVRMDLVDEPPRNRVNITLWGWGGGGLTLNYPRDTTFVVPYLAARPEMVLWAITNEQGVRTRYNRDFTLAPLDTIRVRVAF